MGNYPINNYSPYNNSLSNTYQADAYSGASPGRPLIQMIRRCPIQNPMFPPTTGGNNPISSIIDLIGWLISQLLELIGSFVRFPFGGEMRALNSQSPQMTSMQATNGTTAVSTEKEREGGIFDSLINGASKIGSLFDKDSKIGGLLSKGYDFLVDKVGGFFSSLF